MEIESFDEFYLVTRATLLGQLTAMTADPEVAKEVLQDAYAQAWQRATLLMPQPKHLLQGSPPDKEAFP